MKEIEERAFYGCSKLSTVISLNPEPLRLRSDPFVVYDTLFVPRGSSEKYRQTIVWKDFQTIKEIDTQYKLTYIVDGEIYKTYEVEANDFITPESEPDKEGFIFSGWSSIPYLMPIHDVTITGSFVADPDYSGIYTVSNDPVSSQEFYALDGKKYDKLQKGLNIVRMSDGSVKKILVR